MNSNTIWLEVDKTNQAILSYYLEQPTSPSNKCDYVQATQDELTFLNALEDAVLPAGMVATLSDLQDHRARVQAAKKAKVAQPTTPAPIASHKPSNSDSERSSNSLKKINDKAKSSLIRALRGHSPHK